MISEERIEMNIIDKLVKWFMGENGEEERLKKEVDETIMESKKINEATMHAVNESLSYVTIDEANLEVSKVRERRKTRKMNGKPSSGRSNHISFKRQQ